MIKIKYSSTHYTYSGIYRSKNYISGLVFYIITRYNDDENNEKIENIILDTEVEPLNSLSIRTEIEIKFYKDKSKPLYIKKENKMKVERKKILEELNNEFKTSMWDLLSNKQLSRQAILHLNYPPNLIII